MKDILKNNLRRWSLAHRYYKITRFYSFLKNTAYQAFFMIVIFVLLLMAVNYFITDINLLLNNIFETYSPKIIVLSFFISESILGLIPPEIFILWTSKSDSPILFLFAIASASYLGGIVSYFIGMRISLMPAVRKHIERKIKQHIINLRKWGGVFIVLGAISPIPHSIVSIGAGLINYKFKYYLLWSLFRYLRFVVYFLIILQVL
ncbi:MAG: YqaA family protein [Flavobacteriales bacterium]